MDVKGFFRDVGLPTLFTSILVSLVVWEAGWIIYYRFFHPLAKVPGPFLGSVSELYRFYHNFIRKGALYHEFDKLRERYGPVIRIAPNEVLLTDKNNYEKVYATHSGLYKDPSFYSLIGIDSALFSTISNEVHRRKRAILNPFFSRRAALDQEDIVQSKAAKFCRRIERDSEHGLLTNVQIGLRAVSIDVFTEYAFGADNCYNSLDAEDFGVWYNNLVRGVSPMVYIFKLVPALKAPLQGMPFWLAKKINPLAVSFMTLIRESKRQVLVVVKEIENGVNPKRDTIFHTIFKATGVDAPRVDHIADEAYVLTAAAAETTGNAMAMCAFHVLYNPDIYANLRKELLEAFPNPTAPLDFLSLEKLPYLTGVVKEGLRLSYGVIYPLPRVVPPGGASYNGIYIPEGSVVSMSNWLMHRDPSAFPNPDVFDPERWLDPTEARYREKFLTSFSRGNRMCIGKPLAMCEMYVTIGQMFRKFGDLEAPDIGPEDMTYEDHFSLFHPLHARKFQVIRSGCRAT